MNTNRKKKLPNCVTACCTVPLVPGTEPERAHRKQKLATQTPLELLAKEFEAKKQCTYCEYSLVFQLQFQLFYSPMCNILIPPKKKILDII
jgi:hypothetical protein